MDEEIGGVVKALDDRAMRDNTLIVFQSDNGGTRNPMFSGKVDTSAIPSLPQDRAWLRDDPTTWRRLRQSRRA